MKQSGFSLIELLAAFTIGLICMAVLTSAFVNYKQISTLQHADAEIQENARFVAFRLKKAIEIAGFVGCAKLTDTFSIHNYGVSENAELANESSLHIYQGENGRWLPSIPTYLKITPKKNTDVIVIKNMSPLTNTLLKPITNDDKIIVSLTPKFKAKDNLILADCRHAALLRVHKVSTSKTKKTQTLTTSQTVKETFNTPAEISKLVTTVFFIQFSKRKNKKGEKIYSLYGLDSSGRKEELVPGVTSLKTSCIELNSEGKTVEKAPKTINLWKNVVAVKINITLQSTENVMHKRLSKSVQIYAVLRERVPL